MFRVLVSLILNRSRWLREYNRRRFDRIDRELAIIKAGIISDAKTQARVDAMERKVSAGADVLDSLQK